LSFDDKRLRLRAKAGASRKKPPKGDGGHRVRCRFWQSERGRGEGDTIMKKIALILALAFAITTGITVMTIVADMSLAMADGAGTVVAHPEQANICDETAC
jgi:hypothetical protein